MKVTSSSTSLALQGKSLSRSETIKWIKFATNFIPGKWYNQSMGKRIGLYQIELVFRPDNMPENNYNFVNRYLNNSLLTLKNMLLWGTSNSMSCLDCGSSQTLLYVMSGCEKHLHQGRYTWRHNSVLRALASLLPRGIGELYVDLEGFRSPSEVTGDSKSPDMLIVRPDGTLYLVELTVCYETKMPKNAQIE